MKSEIFNTFDNLVKYFSMETFQLINIGLDCIKCMYVGYIDHDRGSFDEPICICLLLDSFAFYPALSCTQQGRRREASVKTLLSTFMMLIF